MSVTPSSAQFVVDKASFGLGVAFVAVGAAIVKGVSRLWGAFQTKLHNDYLAAKDKRIQAKRVVDRLGFFTRASTRCQAESLLEAAQIAETEASIRAFITQDAEHPDAPRCILIGIPGVIGFFIAKK